MGEADDLLNRRRAEKSGKTDKPPVSFVGLVELLKLMGRSEAQFIIDGSGVRVEIIDDANGL